MFVNINKFPTKLRDLILFGDPAAGIAPAYGPVYGHNLDGSVDLRPWLLNPKGRYFIEGNCRRFCDDTADMREGWSVKVEEWTNRFAEIAAYLLIKESVRSAYIDVDLDVPDKPFLYLWFWQGGPDISCVSYQMNTGSICIYQGRITRNIKALPELSSFLRQEESPLVGLMLALYHG